MPRTLRLPAALTAVALMGWIVCWALMLALLALGAGSLLWMAAVATAIFVEKVTSAGALATAPVALALLGTAVWVGL